MKHAEPEFPGQLMYRDGLESLYHAIRRLEAWHRDWEIRNRDWLITPTFATEHEVTHEHMWVFTEALTSRGRFVDRCDACRVYRKHVAGTPTAADKLYIK